MEKKREPFRILRFSDTGFRYSDSPLLLLSSIVLKKDSFN